MSSTTGRQRSIPEVAAAPRPLFVRPAYLGLVLAGGAVGTTVRYELESRLGAPAGQWPWVTFWINIGGSFLLGALLTVLAATGADHGWRRRVRLTVGTGVIGGFTTYSTFIVEVDQLVRGGHPVRGATYAVASVALGVGAALVGAQLGRRAAGAWAARGQVGS